MDPMEFMFHDTAGPPTHANNMPPSSTPWLAPSPAFLPQWSYSTPTYPHYDANNTAYASSYAPLPSTAHYMPSGVSSAARLPAGLSPNSIATSSWPPSSVQQPSVNNLPTGPFGTVATANVNTQHIRFAAAARANRLSSTQTPSAFVQTAGATNLHALPRTVNPQPNAASHVQLNPESLSFLPAAASSRPSSTLQARQGSPSNQETLRGHQSRNRVSQTTQHGHSSSTPTQNIASERFSQISTFSERRRLEHFRGRRQIGARFTTSEPYNDSSNPRRSAAVLYPGHRRHPSIHQTSSMDDAESRSMQLLRGSINSKSVASKAALQSLQVVKLQDLTESERSCVICYNEYETRSPEGICEIPVRLPKCKHVFGNHCIRKWFQDSDSCPYCRDKLHSEPKHYPSSARSFMDMMRIRGWAVGSEMADDFYRRIMNGDDIETILSASRSTSERRPPPDSDNDEPPRRIRQRRSSSSSTEQVPSPQMRNAAGLHRGALRRETTRSSPGQTSPPHTMSVTNPWIFMGSTSPQSQSSTHPDMPTMYQSPAHAVTSPAIQQFSSVMPNNVRGRRLINARVNGVASNGGGSRTAVIPNPLLNNAQVSIGLQRAPNDITAESILGGSYEPDQGSP